MTVKTSIFANRLKCTYKSLNPLQSLAYSLKPKFIKLYISNTYLQ